MLLSSVKTFDNISLREHTTKPRLMAFFFYFLADSPYMQSSVGAARKVSPNWSQETMTCHSFNCCSIPWGQG